MRTDTDFGNQIEAMYKIYSWHMYTEQSNVGKEKHRMAGLPRSSTGAVFVVEIRMRAAEIKVQMVCTNTHREIGNSCREKIRHRFGYDRKINPSTRSCHTVPQTFTRIPKRPHGTSRHQTHTKLHNRRQQNHQINHIAQRNQYRAQRGWKRIETTMQQKTHAGYLCLTMTREDDDDEDETNKKTIETNKRWRKGSRQRLRTIDRSGAEAQKRLRPPHQHHHKKSMYKAFLRKWRKKQTIKNAASWRVQ